MTEILKSWSIDVNRSLTGLALHDGLLTGVIVENRNAEMRIKNAKGNHLRLLFEGIGPLFVDGFREGNIIGDVWILDAKSNAMRALSKCFAHLGNEAAAEKEAERLLSVNPELLVMHMEPVYGAEAVVSFQSMKAYEAEKWQPIAT